MTQQPILTSLFNENAGKNTRSWLQGQKKDTLDEVYVYMTLFGYVGIRRGQKIEFPVGVQKF